MTIPKTHTNDASQSASNSNKIHEPRTVRRKKNSPSSSKSQYENSKPAFFSRFQPPSRPRIKKQFRAAGALHYYSAVLGRGARKYVTSFATPGRRIRQIERLLQTHVRGSNRVRTVGEKFVFPGGKRDRAADARVHAYFLFFCIGEWRGYDVCRWNLDEGGFGGDWVIM